MKLPTGWAATTLRKLGGTVGGKTPSKAVSGYWTGGTIPWVSPKDMKIFKIAGSEDKITHQALIGGSMNLLPTDSVLMVTRSGILAHTFPVAITGCAVTINQDIKAVRPSSAFNSKWLAYSLRAQSATILGECTKAGTTVASVEMEALESLPIPMPPLPEQTRIADKLDTVLTRVDACRDRLARVAPLLKRFRQSVLAAATSGQLTEEWRTANPHSPGYSKTELNQHRAAIKNRLKVPGAPARLEEGLLYPLPVSWGWIQNHELARDNSNSICAGPFGTIFKAADFRSSGIPIIFLRHVSEGRYLTSKPGFMDSAVWNEFHRPYSVHGGELLVTKLGDPPGTACIYPKNIGVAMVTPDVLKMDVDEDAADVAYLMYFFNSPNAKRIIESMCFGVTRLRIDMAMFKSFPIPLPPRLEQTEIVRRVETMFAFADRLEARLKTAQTAADRLTPALLAKAFRGELVPQDPSDEPASELLQRLATFRPNRLHKSKA